MKMNITEKKVLILLVCVLVVAFFSIELKAGDSEQLKTGTTAPPFMLKTLNYDKCNIRYAGISDYIGKSPKKPAKILLISFFATYCKPCKKELPYLEQLYQKYQDKGLQIIVVSIDKEPELIDEAKEIASKLKLTFPVLSDRFNIVARRYFANNLPCLYALDKNGVIDMVSVGYNKNIGSVLLEKVQTGLGLPKDPNAVPALDHGDEIDDKQALKIDKSTRKD